MTTIGAGAEVLVVEGRIRCIKCSDLKLPGEMHSEDRLCQACYEALKARNAGKPKPKSKPKNNNPNPSLIGLGWKEREEKPIRTVSPDYYKPTMIGGIRVPDTRRELTDNDCDTSVAEKGIRVSETEKRPSILNLEKSVCIEGIKVPDTKTEASDDDTDKSIAKSSIRVSETGKEPQIIDFNKTGSLDGIRVSELERYLDRTNELLAEALRKIKALEKKIEMLSPVIEKEGAKRDAAGLKKLRDDLHRLLQDRMQKKKIDGIYVHSLYGPKGRKGGKLGISKMQAFRLRDACRTDSCFKVEKAENQRGNWLIRLNIYMK